MSGDSEQEFFAAGLTEAIIGELARVSGLRVISCTTAMHYKNARRTLPETVSEFHVDAVIEGTVLRSDCRVRISVQLIDGRTDTHLWAENYDRDVRELLGLYSELANAVANEVRRKAECSHTFACNPPLWIVPNRFVRTVDPGAYEAYLKGRYHWNKLPRQA